MTNPESKKKFCGYMQDGELCCLDYPCPMHSEWQYHQRPESEWREQFELFIRDEANWFVNLGQFKWGNLKSFIARQRDSEYQRGLAEGAREERSRIIAELGGRHPIIDDALTGRIIPTPPHKSV